MVDATPGGYRSFSGIKKWSAKCLRDFLLVVRIRAVGDSFGRTKLEPNMGGF